MREHIKLMEKLSEMVGSVDEKLESLSPGQIESIRHKIGEIFAIVERRKKI